MIIENITTVLNWKGVPGIQYKILYENWIMRINLNRNIFNIIAAIAPADENLNNFTMIIQNKQNIKSKRSIGVGWFRPTIFERYLNSKPL